MADRTSTSLQLLGTITAEALEALAEIIEDNEGSDDWGNPETGVWGWSDVTAELDADTIEAIAEAGLSCAFWWDSYPGAFSAGVEVHTPEGVTSWGAEPDNSEIMLTVTQASDPDTLARAKAHHALIDAGLTVTEAEAVAA